MFLNAVGVSGVSDQAEEMGFHNYYCLVGADG